jgi:hypothetical protein
MWESEANDRLIVRGRANLLANEGRSGPHPQLFDDLERKRDIAQFLELTEQGEGVRIFIGSENKLFSLSGSSLVVSPYMNADRKIMWRGWRDRSDAAQLRAHRADCRLHRAAGRPDAVRPERMKT